jgi:hypothetical protein
MEVVMSNGYLFPRPPHYNFVVLKDHEKIFHLDHIDVIRNQVTTAEALLVVGEISGSRLKKIRAECHNLEQNYIKTRGLFYHAGLVQEATRYEEERYPEPPAPAPEAEGGRTGAGPSEPPLGEDREGEGVLESGPSEEGRT